MSTVFKVNNMHCQSCVKLVTLGIEDDPSLRDKLTKVEISNTADCIGRVEFDDLDEQEQAKARTLIESSGNYKVLS